MKKKICLALCLVLLLAGCGRAEAPTEPALNIGPTGTSGEPTEVRETLPPVTAPKGPYDGSQEVVYAGAAKEFLTPVEDYSWDREARPEYVMLHYNSAVVNHRDDPYNVSYVRDIFEDYHVSTHYLVDRDGNIHCFMPENRVAWHAGEGTFLDDPKYENKMNLYSIGIEILGIGTRDEMRDYLTEEEYDALDKSLIGFTDAQYEALKGLIGDICQRYGIPMDQDHVIGHEDFAPDTTDPGRLFQWNRIFE